MINIKDKKIIDYNSKVIPIKKLILKYFNKKNIKDILKLGNDEYVYKCLYDLTTEKEFKNLYFKIVKHVANNLNIRNFYFQTIPSFRIQKSNQKSVNFHNDVMYGHGESVINAWIPFCNIVKENSLWLVSDNDSKNIIYKFKKQKQSISEMNSIAIDLSKPAILKENQILIFKTKTLHGTKENSSNCPRISIDFRILEKGKNPGNKSLNEFYTPNFSINKFKKNNCITYLNKKNFFLENLNHSDQRQIIKSYCLKNNLSSILEETEIWNCDHYPNLIYLISVNKTKDLVLPTILSLPEDKKIRNNIVILSNKYKKNIHFALENITLNKTKIQKINKYFSQMNKYYNLK